jgi:hypothetical protein
MTHEAAPFHRQALPATDAAAAPDPAGPVSAGPVLIDCDTCCARGVGCGDCVVTVLLGGPPAGVTLNDEERRAVDVLAAAGLVPPLRLVYGVESPFIESE